MDFKNINLSDFIRYILSGFNFIVIVVGFPLIYFDPLLFKDLLTSGSVITIFLVSISVGFLMDSLKIYQLTPRFQKNKTEFRKAVAQILDVPVEDAPRYVSLVSKLWGQQSSYNLEQRRAQWVLTLHTAVTLFISVFVWGYSVVYEYLQLGISTKLIIPLVIILISLILTVRLLNIGRKEIYKSDQEIFLILKANKKKILNAWRIEGIDHRQEKATK